MMEALESRQLLAMSPYFPINSYPLNDFLIEHDPGPTPAITIAHPIGTNPAILATYQNAGRELTGQDRQGDRWQLKLTGPGQIIVTDVTPADGVLDDNLNTIRLVGTSPTLSSLHGQVQETARTPTDFTQLPTLGQLKFNSLIADRGVKAIILNGFVLTDTVTPDFATGLNATTGINLRGGVGRLSFEGIDARLPASQNPNPINIVIGGPTTPLTVKPSIRIDHITNTVYDDTAFQTGGTGLVPTGPLTSPTVSLVVNGAVQKFDVVSVTQATDLSTLLPPINNTMLTIPAQFIPTNSAAIQYQFPVVGTTGRTSVQARSIEAIKVNGAATNITFSKSAQPFQSSLTGLDHVGTAQFGGPTDALAIDSRGNIGGLRFARGIGNPTGVDLNPINFGSPPENKGYPASGLLGAQIVTEGNIGHIIVAPNGQFLQIPQDPGLIQSGLSGETAYVNRPGTAISSSLIAAAKSIGRVHVVGDMKNSEIKSGFDYFNALGGAQGVSGASKIGPARIRGNIVDSVVAASYEPGGGIYGGAGSVAGDGTITGNFDGQVYQTTTGRTVLGNAGSGFFSRFDSTHPRTRHRAVQAPAHRPIVKPPVHTTPVVHPILIVK